MLPAAAVAAAQKAKEGTEDEDLSFLQLKLPRPGSLLYRKRVGQG